MTVVVAIYCTDGVVVASDSMLTNSMGNLGTTETKGKKVYPMKDEHLFALAGDPALAARFRAVLEQAIIQTLPQQTIALDYLTNTTATMINHFNATSLQSPFNLQVSLSYIHHDKHYCAFFGADMQPRLLDSDHYWLVFGSGKQYADPFLSFLTDVFCDNQQPNTSTGKFLATWAVNHAIQTNTGGVNGPVQMAVLQKQEDGSYEIEEQTARDIDDQAQAIDAAKCALVDWRDKVAGNNENIDEAMPPPTA